MGMSKMNIASSAARAVQVSFDARTQVNRCQTGYPKPRDERVPPSSQLSGPGPRSGVAAAAVDRGRWTMDYGPWTMAHIIGKSPGPQIRVLLQWYKGGLGGV
ncbi:hypothetical protein CPLU01_11668 [Colletotrichum plurivorum]|uniref:Uncharacterized protein n=1 Tax=Colletotrichum plurivorum TaxID=2175906 RepID=A0A8H6K0V7_9PEZI|nr:hypothetical protein CPLU01_11668 [Colletotrichum plurivorum]